MDLQKSRKWSNTECYNHRDTLSDETLTYPMCPSADGCMLWSCCCCQFVTDPRPDPPKPDKADRSLLSENSASKETKAQKCLSNRWEMLNSKGVLVLLLTCAIRGGQRRGVPTHSLARQSLSSNRHSRGRQSLSTLGVIYSLVLWRRDRRHIN